MKQRYGITFILQLIYSCYGATSVFERQTRFLFAVSIVDSRIIPAHAGFPRDGGARG